MQIPVRPASRPPRWLVGSSRSVWLAAGLVVLAAGTAYRGSFTIPFVFDDVPAIADNPTLRSLWPLGPVLTPPSDGRAVTGRPLVNLSLALNHAVGGLDPRGYHVVNLLIHGLAGLTLFGLVRRTLQRTMAPDVAWRLALLTALLWVVHPLQTESVSFVVQRTESLVGLFYLLSLYAFVRSVDAPGGVLWPGGVVLVCFLGMATKEVMVSAPLALLLYDRTFVSGSFGVAWRRHRALHAGAFASWLLLLLLVTTEHGTRSDTWGFDPATNSWTYLLKQCEAIVHYLKLSFWPFPLILDYGTDCVQAFRTVTAQALLLLAAFGATLVALVRWPGGGFLGFWFFAIIAPSSSVVPLPAQTMAEHRMYLPLAAIMLAGALGLHRLFGRRSLLFGGVFVLASIALTARRNHDYQSEELIWRDTVAKRPANARAHYNLGCALEKTNRAQAIAAYEAALRLAPTYAAAHNNLGGALTETGLLERAVFHLETALRLRPDFIDARHNLGNALMHAGRFAEAVPHFEAVLRERPGDALSQLGLGNALVTRGQLDAAAARYETVLRFKPDSAEAHYNLGTILIARGRTDEALRHFDAALQIKPAFLDALNNAGTALLRLGRTAEAAARYEAAARLQPGRPDVRGNLAVAYRSLGRPRDAIGQFEAALQLNPRDAEAGRQLSELRQALQAEESAKK